jgi:hypothetical protein
MYTALEDQNTKAVPKVRSPKLWAIFRAAVGNPVAFDASPHYHQACAHVARMLSLGTVAVRNGDPDYYNREV